MDPGCLPRPPGRLGIGALRGFDLLSPRAAEDFIGRFFLDGTPACISVSEDVTFERGWLELGAIILKAAAPKRSEVVSAVRRGAYRWDVPDEAQVSSQLRTLFGLSTYAAKAQKAQKAAEERLRGLLDRMASVAVRTGLARPRFHARSLAEMPFRRPTTILADTSGVIQGAMSFVADHLHPMARMKIPAVLHMEVINQADRFMKTRRSDGVRGEVLLGEHLLSQTGQRTLLRLELREHAEVERNLLISDRCAMLSRRIAIRTWRSPRSAPTCRRGPHTTSRTTCSRSGTRGFRPGRLNASRPAWIPMATCSPTW